LALFSFFYLQVFNESELLPVSSWTIEYCCPNFLAFLRY